MFVCICSAVSDHDIVNAINDGVSSFEEMQDNLGVAKTCGACTCEVKSLLHDRLNKSLASRINHPTLQTSSQLPK